MRKTAWFSCLLCLWFCSFTFAIADSPSILLDGNELEFDVPPMIESGRTLIPLRSLFENMGAAVSYDPATRSIQVHMDATRIVLRVDRTTVWLNGEPTELDVPARVVDGRTLIPLRFVAESLGIEVRWEPRTSTIYLDTDTSSLPALKSDYEDEAGLHRFFLWKYKGVEQTTEILLDPSLVSHYTHKTRIPSDDYSIYVTDSEDDTYLNALAIQFRKKADALGLNEQELINYVITFVQFLEYRTDQDANGINEYPQYPLETLDVKSGDCEDSSILLASLLEALGHDPVIIHYPGVHTAVGLGMLGQDSLLRYRYDNKIYTYIETTRPYSIGKIPDEYVGLDAVFFKIVPAPAVRFRWESNAMGISIKVWNEGTGAADTLQVQVQIVGTDGTVYSSKVSPSEYLQADASTSVWLDLTYPESTRFRLHVSIFNAGKVMAESNSKWFGAEE